MKKIIISILICALAIGLCACEIKTKTYPDEKKQMLSEQFTIIKEIDGGIFDYSCYYIYDNETKIVYLYTIGGSRSTMCPYYIIKNNQPTNAIYGVNYYG